MNLALMEAAIADWVLAVTGLIDKQVYFTHQKNNADNTANRVSITIGEIPTRGQSETIQSYDKAAPLEKEITIEQLSMATMTVSIQIYGPAVVGSTGPRQVGSSLRASLELDSVRAPLRAAGLGVNVCGSLQWVPAVAGRAFEGRANFDVLFSCSESASERLGYVGSVVIRGNVDGTEVLDVTIVEVPPSGLMGAPVQALAVVHGVAVAIGGTLLVPTSAIDVTFGP